MTEKHNNLRRILHRSQEEMRASAEIAKTTSAAGAAVTLLAKMDIQKMNRNGFREPEPVKRRLMKKHAVMMQYFETKFADFISQYDFGKGSSEESPKYPGKIWQCWWQEPDNAPEVVKVCMSSVRRNAPDREVIVITERNYKDYVTFPDWIEKKYQAGIISRTHYSDLLRFSLLAEYGGVWLDASMYCADACFEDIFAQPVWTIKRPDYLHGSIASGYFATYSFACREEYRWIFRTIRDFLLQYWKENDILIDYLMLDYLIALALKQDNCMAEVFQNIPANNPDCDELVKLLHQPFDKNKWEQIHAQTGMFKLTWKQTFPDQNDGQNTFYAKLKEWEHINDTV